MKLQRLVCVVGGAFTFALFGAGIVACSGDDTNPAAPVADSGPDSTADSGPGGQDGSTSDANGSQSDTGTTDAADAGCDKMPTLHAAGSAGPYCPFIDGGEGSNCAADQLCCLDETNDLLNGSCQTTTACPTPTAFFFQCSGPSNCNIPSATVDGGADGGDAGNGGDVAADDASAPQMVCCGFGPAPTVEGACPSYDLESDLSATVCASTCTGLGDGGSNALIICDTATGECPAGLTCTPFRTHGAELGFCM